MSDPRAPNNGQLSKKLPGVTTFVTGHTADGKAVVEAKRPGSWLPYDEDRMAFMQVYTSSFPANLNDKQDLQAHDQLMKSGTLGLVKPGGVVCRQVWNFQVARILYAHIVINRLIWLRVTFV